MTKRMLIDASHPEETRVVVIDDRQLEDFDFESSTKKQLKGNIYLAKVTRVEPSLQAAFVDYGGQRHGFLAFSEIHPDYYQIPQADRRLLKEPSPPEVEAAPDPVLEPDLAPEEAGANGADDDAPVAAATDPDEEAAEVFDEQARQRSRLLRGYKIQEVIKRRQIMLVQVVKEERGNKGAALTTYMSLAGRYCVLMPNTGRGGGISRKIANAADRAKLKAIARELEVPDGMGLIIRTAGQQRNKLEIKRDYEYLLRLWNDIRELTLRSVAPCTIHEEGALVKRAVRDLYGRDVDEVWVEGEEGYRTARKVMSMLMPSRARRVKLYKDELPLFHRYGVEEQLDSLHQPVIHLRSGASIVIHTTEALTAIDVNSGRSTRERNIEETALKTNLEAAEEIARQLRLRDIAGLVVVDFIDMDELRNQRAVERRLAGSPEDRSGAGAAGPDQRLRPAGIVAPAAAPELPGAEHPALPDLHRHGRDPLGRIGGAAGAARDRARGHEGQGGGAGRDPAARGGALHPQPEARPPGRPRATLWHERRDRGRYPADRGRLPGREHRRQGRGRGPGGARRGGRGTRALRPRPARRRPTAAASAAAAAAAGAGPAMATARRTACSCRQRCRCCRRHPRSRGPSRSRPPLRPWPPRPSIPTRRRRPRRSRSASRAGRVAARARDAAGPRRLSSRSA